MIRAQAAFGGDTVAEKLCEDLGCRKQAIESSEVYGGTWVRAIEQFTCKEAGVDLGQAASKKFLA